MKASIPLLLTAALTIFVSGCATSPVLRPPSTKLRDRLGNVTVVAHSNASRIRYQVPDSREDIACEKLNFEVVTPRMVVSKIGPVGSAPEAMVVGALAFATPVVVMGGAPLWHEIRRMYGNVVADSANDVASARTTLDAATARVSFKEQLNQQLISRLREQAPTATIVPTRRDADTILELMAYEPSISGAEGINPGLQLSVGLRVRLLDARSGSELYYDYLDYRSSKFTLVAWAAHDARVFHAELERCLAHLSTEVVAQLFTRAPTVVADREMLAGLGIERRPAVIPSYNTSPAPSLPQNRRALARK